jgi:GGDEF domain-containing protein
MMTDEAEQAGLALICEVGAAITSSLVLEDVLTSVAQRVAEAFRVWECDFYEYDAVHEQVIAVACWCVERSPEDDARVGRVFEVHGPHGLGRVIQDRQIVEECVDDSQRTEADGDPLGAWGEKSAISVPLVFEDQVLGCLSLIEKREVRHFSEEERELLRTLALPAAVAIHNARLYRRLDEQNDRLGALNDRLSAFVGLSEQMRGLIDEEQMLHLLGRVMAEVLDYGQWAAYMYDGEARAFNVISSIGGATSVEAEQAERAIPAPVIEGLIAGATPMSRSFFVDHRRHVWTEEQHFWLPAEDLGERAPDEWHWDDTLFVPMVSELGELLGYIEAYDPVDRRLPSVEDVRLLEVFAAKASSDLELHRLYEQLAEQARTDGLTGLTNHRHFMERLDDEVAKARRYGTSLSLLMLDLDDFEPFNDTYGHPQGDKLLRGVAGILRGTTRDRVDLVARYGGEEFVVLLPSTPAAGATATGERIVQNVSGDARDAVGVAETIRRMMAESLFEGFPSRDEVHMTVSVGVATFPDHAGSAFELVVNADKALYLAKRMGKNRVRVFD